MRVVRGASSAVLGFQPVDQHGEPADPGAAVAVDVTRLDGANVPATIAGAGANPRTATIAGSELRSLDRLMVKWSIGGDEVAADLVDVVGGILATAATLKAVDPSLNSIDDESLRAAIEQVEALVEDELNRCLHPKVVVDRTFCGAHHTTSRADVRSVVGAWTADGEVIDVTGATATTASISGPRFVDGGTVAYIAHMDSPPPDLIHNLTLAVRQQLSMISAGLPYNAESFRAVDGEVIGLARAGIGQSITGNDDVDARIKAYRWQQPGIA